MVRARISHGEQCAFAAQLKTIASAGEIITARTRQSVAQLADLLGIYTRVKRLYSYCITSRLYVTRERKSESEREREEGEEERVHVLTILCNARSVRYAYEIRDANW